MTKTAIISFDSNDKSIRKIIEGLVSMGVITFEEYPYNQAMVEKIKRGDQAIKEGKGIIINPTELNIFCWWQNPYLFPPGTLRKIILPNIQQIIVIQTIW